ncbi:hypothetical protein ACFL27_24680, partial [candidate division CSSED10-310 bacterium]
MAHEEETYVSVVDVENLVLAEIINGITSHNHLTIDLVLDQSVTPCRLHVLHNYFKTLFQTEGWMATVTLSNPHQVVQRRCGVYLSDLVVDEVRHEVIVS